MEIDRWDIEAWAAKSRKGEVCGIFGCLDRPVVKCAHCGNYYCEEHSFVLKTPGHMHCGGHGEGEEGRRKAKK